MINQLSINTYYKQVFDHLALGHVLKQKAGRKDRKSRKKLISYILPFVVIAKLQRQALKIHT